MKRKNHSSRRRAKTAAASPPRRAFKDRLFCRLFSEREAALSLFNAASGTAYTDMQELQITTLEDSLYPGMKNDLAICFHDSITLFEQQSSVNPNMPLRGLLYFARQYQNWLTAHEMDLHAGNLICIPSPRYYVLYNGPQGQPKTSLSRLSDSFLGQAEGYEWTAQLLNINAGAAHPILERCPLLCDYSLFVQEVREAGASGVSLAKALGQAIDTCIAKDILKPYLTKHKAEVTQMLLTEFNQELHERTVRREGFEDGFRQGQTELLSCLLKMASCADVSLTGLSAILPLSPELIQEAAKAAGISLDANDEAPAADKDVKADRDVKTENG